MAKTFKVQAPIGNSIIPKEVMTERELRDHALQLLTPEQQKDPQDTWTRKIKEDEVEEVAEWLQNLGYQVKLIK